MAAIEEKVVVIKSTDMSEEMQEEVIRVASEALELYSFEKDIAAHVKREFESGNTGSWNCIVGKNFGAFVAHEQGKFIYLYIGNIAFMLFKSG